MFEEVINVYINGDFYASFHCIPLQIKELIVGHLLTEAIIEDVKNIIDLKISEKNIYVRLSEKKALNHIKRQPSITTFCSDIIIQPSLSRKTYEQRLNKIKFSVEAVFKAVEVLNSISSIYKVSRGSHGAVLVDRDSNVVSFAEDVGRHNAVDKVIGDAALKGINLTKLLLVSTGRLTSEIVAKAAQVGIPVLASLAAPTSLGVSMANDLGLTLIGFAGGEGFNIYSSPGRIVGDIL